MEKKDRLETDEMLQNRRWAMSIAVTDFFQEKLGLENEVLQPYLEVEKDEKSDLILNLDFGPGLKGEARFPYEGGVNIVNNENLLRLFVSFRKRFEELLEKIHPVSASVIIENT